MSDVRAERRIDGLVWTATFLVYDSRVRRRHGKLCWSAVGGLHRPEGQFCAGAIYV
jgi:hypothetical protein